MIESRPITIIKREEKKMMEKQIRMWKSVKNVYHRKTNNNQHQ